MNVFEINTIEEGGILRFPLKGPGTTARVLREVAAIITETQSRNIGHVLCDATPSRRGLPASITARRDVTRLRATTFSHASQTCRSNGGRAHITRADWCHRCEYRLDRDLFSATEV